MWNRWNKGEAVINLPVLYQLDVEDYGLFPGSESNPGLHTTITPGLKLILGANGLGKTTLVTILYRMLTGPSDIPNLDSADDLGTRRLVAKRLNFWDRQIFAQRVRDGAAEARATLGFYLGETNILITRSLKTLDLLNLCINDEEIVATDDAFEQIVQERAGVSSFGDWILALRLLTFYFEDRRALIWDPTAQIQLFRLLFLPPNEAEEMTVNEREILELDSTVRNTRYILRRQERTIARTEGSLKTADEIRQQLKLSQAIQQTETARLDELNDQLATATANREEARLNALKAEQDHESAMRNLERLQLRAIEDAFPNATEVGKYVIGQILAEDKCLTCGSIVPEFAQEIQDRIHQQRCPVCGSSRNGDDAHRSTSKRDHGNVMRQVEGLEQQVHASSMQKEAVEEAFDNLLNEIAALNASTTRRTAYIDELVRRLPPAEQKVHEQRSVLTAARAQLAEEQARLFQLRQEFKEFMAAVNQKIAQRSDAIKTAFDEYAEGFLFESCELAWSPRKRTVGQEGELVEYAAFQLDMTGSDFETVHRRTGPAQVSESQREFIDLSFRMALIDIASGGGGSLVVDAPESSLDAVFATKAADVLIRFCETRDTNRLVVTSNLVDGDMIPELMKKASVQSEQDPRIVDLLEIAIPTAAVRRYQAQYVAVRRNLFQRARAVD